jgi:hypothetical protein
MGKGMGWKSRCGRFLLVQRLELHGYKGFCIALFLNHFPILVNTLQASFLP